MLIRGVLFQLSNNLPEDQLMFSSGDWMIVFLFILVQESFVHFSQDFEKLILVGGEEGLNRLRDFVVQFFCSLVFQLF